MTVHKGKLILATAISLVLAGCGGDTSEPVVTEAEVSTPLQESAADTSEIIQESVTEADNVLEQAADSTSAAANSAADSAMDTVDGAGWADLQNNWQDSIVSIKDRWADLSEEELLSVNGDRDALVTLVQDKYGLDRDKAESEVDDWASGL